MLKQSIKNLLILSSIIFAAGCSDSVKDEKQGLGNSGESVIVECKGDAFNATFEFLPMTKKILSSIDAKSIFVSDEDKKALNVYAKVKDISFGNALKPNKDCSVINKDSIFLSLDLESLNDLGKHSSDEFFLYADNKVCTQQLDLVLDSKYDSYISRDFMYKNKSVEAEKFSSKCQVNK